MSICQRFLAVSMFCCSLHPVHADTHNPLQQVTRQAIQKALPLLWEAMEGHSDANRCFSCHHHGLPILAITTAAKSGFSIDKSRLQQQRMHIEQFFEANVNDKQLFQPPGGRVSTSGWGLFALHLSDRPADSVTKAVVDYTLREDAQRTYWQPGGNRPPSEGSRWMTTFVGLQSLRLYGQSSQQPAITKRIESVRAWISTEKPKDHEDRVFRLLALHEIEASAEELEGAAQSLLQLQQPNGSWSQLDPLPGDAYATANALYALNRTGKLHTSAQAYRAAIHYLLSTQRSDGSWHVGTRSRPIQKYFESGFPHGKDQFISCAATAWAVTALSHSINDSVK